jgi:hypothetical protein
VVAVLHFHARDIGKDEVAVFLNGRELAMVPPDTLEVDDRNLEVVLPAGLVQVGEENLLVFDNLRNPPQRDPWRIWNVRLEVLPIPELSRRETLIQANASIERARKDYRLRDVGPENLFQAWKHYRQAWLLLESLPERPERIYAQVRLRLKQLGPEMDLRCGNLLLAVKKEIESPQADHRRIRNMLKNVSSFFPTPEHHCHPISKQILSDFSS